MDPDTVSRNIPAKIHNLIVVMRKHERNQTVGYILQNHRPGLFKNMLQKTKAEELIQTKEDLRCDKSL